MYKCIIYIYLYIVRKKNTYTLTFDNRYFLSLHFKNNNYFKKNYI